MSINLRQAQFELFPHSVGGGSKDNEPRYSFVNLTLPMENIIVVGILFIIAMVFSFSLGVERGKRVSVNTGTTGVLEEVSQEKTLAPRRRVKTIKPPPDEIPALLVSVPKTTQAVPIRESVAKSSQKTYTIQVASFKKAKYAKEEASGLKKIGYEIFVLPKGNYSIVCVGKFSQKEQAKVLLSQLKKKYKDCLVRRL